MGITSNIGLPAVTKKSGVRAVWVLGNDAQGNPPNITSFGGFTNPPTYLNPGFTISPGGLGSQSIVGTGTWYNYAIVKGSGDYKQKQVRSGENSSIYYDCTLTFTLAAGNEKDADTTEPAFLESQLLTLSSLRYNKVIILDYSGNYRALGFFDGLEVTDETDSSGKKPGDNNGYNVTMYSQERNRALWLSTDIVTACYGQLVNPMTAY
jgi:hypothetical protein